MSLQTYLHTLDDAEKQLVLYRATESDLRVLVYGSLWSSRLAQQHPLSRHARAKGRKDEAYYLGRIVAYERASEEHFHRLRSDLEQLVHGEQFFRDCLVIPQDLRYFESALKPSVSFVERINSLLNKIVENENLYRAQIFAAAGGREGKYPEVTVEARVDHAPYFDRFEIDRVRSRNDETTESQWLFQSLRRFVQNHFKQDSYCIYSERAQIQDMGHPHEM